MFFSGNEDAGPTMHDFSPEQPTARHAKTKDRCIEHASSEGVVTDCTNQRVHHVIIKTDCSADIKVMSVPRGDANLSRKKIKR